MKQLNINWSKAVSILFVGLILLGVFLRFYKIGEWQYFHFDQARDYLIAYRIFHEHKFTLVGPTVLIPGVYLPPFYYYSLIPFLALFKWLPIGGDVYTSIMGCVSIGLLYLLARKISKSASLFLTVCYSLNPYLIQTSRHAWNPNTTNLWTIAFLLCIINYRQGRKIFLVIAGAILGLSLSFHYPLLFLTPVLLWMLWQEGKKGRVVYPITSLLLFLLPISPLILFDFRHQWSNTRAIVGFLSGTDGLGGSVFTKLTGLTGTIIKLPPMFLGGLNQLQNLSINPNTRINWSLVQFDSLTWIPYGLIFWFGLYRWIKTFNQPFKKLILFSIFLCCLIPIVFPAKSLFFYHFQFILPLLFIPLVFVWNKANVFIKLLLFVMMILPLTSLKLNQTVKNSSYFQAPVNIIKNDYQKNPVDKINVVANLTDHWQHHAPEYRYFMKITRLPMLSDLPQDYLTADLVYLIDEGNLVNPLQVQGAEMNNFNPITIKEKWETGFNQKIYRLEK